QGWGAALTFFRLGFFPSRGCICCDVARLSRYYVCVRAASDCSMALHRTGRGGGKAEELFWHFPGWVFIPQGDAEAVVLRVHQVIMYVCVRAAFADLMAMHWTG
ncbi:unnamed protein product, partial [Laminaria digitata]